MKEPRKLYLAPNHPPKNLHEISRKRKKRRYCYSRAPDTERKHVIWIKRKVLLRDSKQQFPTLQLAFYDNFVNSISHVLDVLSVETGHADATVLQQVDVELFNQSLALTL
jgi:hypothetical protein